LLTEGQTVSSKMTASTRRPIPTETTPPVVPATGSQAVDFGKSERVAQRRREAALRASAEAEARRAQVDWRAAAQPLERGGRDGPDPVRYGDWEVKGIATDF
jgi:hypothetical protein